MRLIVILASLFAIAALAKSSDDLRLAVQYFPERFDPRAEFEVCSSFILNQSFQTLYKYDDQDRVVPHLATNHTIHPDGSVTVHLDTNVTFSDGTRLTADIVKSSLEASFASLRERVRSEFGRLVGFEDFLSRKSSTVRGIVVLSEKSIRFRFDGDSSGFAKSLALPLVAIFKDSANGALGTGPYVFRSKSEHTLTLARRSDLVDLGPKNLVFERVRTYRDLETRIKRGEIDFAELSDLIRAEQVSTPYTHRFDRDMAAIAVSIHFNMNKVSREERFYLGNAFYQSYRKFLPIRDLKIGAPISWHSKVFPPESHPTILKRIRIVHSSEYPDIVLDGIAAELKRYGYDIVFEKMNVFEIVRSARNGDFTVLLVAWMPDYMSADGFLKAVFGTGQANNYSQYSNSRVDTLLSGIAAASDATKKRGLIKEVMEYLKFDCPIVLLGNYENGIISSVSWDIPKGTGAGFYRIDLSRARYIGT